MTDDLALDAYIKARQDVAQALWAVRRFLRQRHGEAGAESVQQLITRLAEDRFNLVVLGQFKRGKSSLMNAIIGRDLLPTAAVPLTSAVTMLRYGATLRVQVWHEGSVLPRQINAAALPEYITERGNPGNEKRVRSAEIEIPEPFLRRGLHFIDTPGIGSVHRHNTATTYRFLPEADAVVFVTSAESPFSDAEAELLQAIRQHVRKVFFVLNKVDQLEPAEQQDVLAFLSRSLAEQMGAASVRVYPLSARLALEAKRTVDLAKLRASGLPVFGQQLGHFLAGERGQLLLVSILDRALRLLEDEQKRLGLRVYAAGWTPAERERHLADLRQFWTELAGQQREALDEARGRAAAFGETTLRPGLCAFATQVEAELLEQLPHLLERHQEEDPESSYSRLRDELTAALLERSRNWLRDRADELDEAGGRRLGTFQAALQRLVDGVPTALAAALHLPAEAIPAVEFPEQPAVAPAQLAGRFELPRPDVSSGAPLYPLPKRLARHFLHRHLEAQLRLEIASAGSALERHIAAVYTWPLEQLARDVEQATERARAQVEAALQAEAETAPAEAAHLVASVSALRDRLLAWSSEVTVASLDGQATDASTSDGQEPAGATPEEQQMEDSHCPVCVEVSEAVFDFLREWQYRLATDPAARQEFREAGGFCPAHSQQLEELASARGLSEGYIDLLDRFSQELRALAGEASQDAAHRLETLLPDTGRCRVCCLRRQAEEGAVRRLAAALNTHAAGGGRGDATLCLPHVSQVLGADLSDEAGQGLVEATTGRLERTTSALSGYALKRDARRRELLSPEEERASKRAVALIAGEGPIP